ncbi:hypothetical protein T492DRAFT_840108 [Pavlovales sp. CCMP2436]|nr:hypothetical protein T492DRAFT_840108 [Pavlovales sp. CCMP2436]
MSIVVGLVQGCEPVAGKDKLKQVLLDVGAEKPVRVVTNAPNVEVGKRLVVALVGATVGEIEVKRTAVGGVVSEGMLCDPGMLGWAGGGAGAAATVPDSFAPGDPAPSSRPRMDGGGKDDGAAAPAKEVEPLFAKKLSKEEKKVLAAQKKAEREAKKAAKGGDEADAAKDEAVEDE